MSNPKLFDTENTITLAVEGVRELIKSDTV
jgi:hypothetical protein